MEGGGGEKGETEPPAAEGGRERGRESRKGGAGRLAGSGAEPQVGEERVFSRLP